MTKKNKDINSLSYEQAQAELQELLGQIEAQSIPLDALLAAYQRCQDLLAHCRSKLNALEQQIQLIDSSGKAPAAQPASQLATGNFNGLDDDLSF